MVQGRGWEGAVLRLLRAKDFEFTVTRAEDVTPHYRRLRLTDGGMLAATGVHPTMWVRLWFDNSRQAAPAGVHPGRPRPGGKHLRPRIRPARGVRERLGPLREAR